ncbi:sulfotransferase 6B1 [Triplophysa rosa]|uniref:Sulfotransferase n=1 Tax=Triplophysa rosa TaxID=992332 RepID=A0A9W7TDX2_TRIRA|nr:sulfotransferase 6B1 [Triplophysa rosa]KAI7795164.1 sulfotransferase 6B1 [Triplophysa rosa]
MSQTEPPSQERPMKARMELAAKMKDEDKLYKRDGILYSTILSPPETLDKLKDLEARDDDVVLVAYPKCGFNWVVAVLRKIMNASTGKNEALPDRPPLVEFLPPDVQQKLSEMPPRRLLGTHLHPDNMPASFFSKKPKILVVFRNPKDTVVSYFHFMNKNPVLPSAEPWDKFFSDFMSGEVPWGSYFDHALAWEKRFDDPNVRIVTYEELKQNLPEEVKKISEFFGFPLTEEQVNSIAEQSTFRAMLETSNKSHGNLGSVFFRKGEVGDWKNLFSEAQSKQMDELFQSKMAGTKLGAQMKYDLYCQ